MAWKYEHFDHVVEQATAAPGEKRDLPPEDHLAKAEQLLRDAACEMNPSRQRELTDRARVHMDIHLHLFKFNDGK